MTRYASGGDTRGGGGLPKGGEGKGAEAKVPELGTEPQRRGEGQAQRGKMPNGARDLPT